MIRATTGRAGVRSPTVLGLTILITIALTAIATWALTASTAAPESDVVGRSAATYPIARTNFADERSVTLQFVQNPDITLRLQVAGTVTSLSCTAGASWSAGSSPISVNDTPVILLSSPSPFYRDLSGGETGPDVAALQTELTTLGFPTRVTTRFDLATRNSLAAFLVKKGLPPGVGYARGDFLLSDFVWMPTASAQIDECGPSLDDDVSPGDELAKVGGGDSEIYYSIPSDLLPGARTLDVNGYSTTATADGKITDPTAIRAIIAMPTVAQYLNASPTEQATNPVPTPQGTLSLKTPVPVYGVPPSSIVSASTHAGCVASGHSVYRITIVSSSLGLTYVGFPATREVPDAVLLHPSQDLKCGS